MIALGWYIGYCRMLFLKVVQKFMRLFPPRLFCFAVSHGLYDSQFCLLPISGQRVGGVLPSRRRAFLA